MKYKKSILLSFVFVIIVFILVMLSSNVETEKVIVKYEIGDKSGFNVNSSSLDFGRLIIGSKGTRVLNVGNVYDSDIKVRFQPSDDLKGVLSYEPGWIKIKQGQSINASFTLIVPNDKIFGNYSGYVKMFIIK